MSTRYRLAGSLALLLAASLSPSLSAAPAPWYLWASQHSDRRICAQTSPGPGWAQVAGPFRDAGCQRTR
ncbi:hypothetical protein [Zoogloea sp.]|uniref:hypothetical protein n=1 Tax=Zoogloea sp. TaxID=49181 RepID=UPI0014167181|nr:MAG: hypothetical protein F9K15_22415 [Zoogloea sp.]